MNWLKIVALCALVACGGGCALFVVGAAAGAGAGTYAYVNGEMTGTQSASLDRTWDATLEAMKELQFPIVMQLKDALRAELTARDAKDTKIEVRLKRVSDTTTEVHVRVGVFGDQTISRAILDKIRAHLT